MDRFLAQKRRNDAHYYLEAGILSRHHQEPALLALGYVYFTGDKELGIEPINDAVARARRIWDEFTRLCHWNFQSCAQAIWQSILRKCNWTPKNANEPKKTAVLRRHERQVSKLQAANQAKHEDSQHRIQQALDKAHSLGMEPSINWLVTRARASRRSVIRFLASLVSDHSAPLTTQMKCSEPTPPPDKALQPPPTVKAVITKDHRSNKEILIVNAKPSQPTPVKLVQAAVTWLSTTEKPPAGSRAVWKKETDETGRLVFREIFEPDTLIKTARSGLIQRARSGCQSIGSILAKLSSG